MVHSSSSRHSSLFLTFTTSRASTFDRFWQWPCALSYSWRGSFLTDSVLKLPNLLLSRPSCDSNQSSVSLILNKLFQVDKKHLFYKYNENWNENVSKLVSKEWRIMNSTVPERVYFRGYSDRMDLMRSPSLHPSFPRLSFFLNILSLIFSFMSFFAYWLSYLLTDMNQDHLSEVL